MPTRGKSKCGKSPKWPCNELELVVHPAKGLTAAARTFNGEGTPAHDRQTRWSHVELSTGPRASIDRDWPMDGASSPLRVERPSYPQQKHHTSSHFFFIFHQTTLPSPPPSHRAASQHHYQIPPPPSPQLQGGEWEEEMSRRRRGDGYLAAH